jgi:hypothetical protein
LTLSTKNKDRKASSLILATVLVLVKPFVNYDNN